MRVKIDGLRELERVLAELPKATGKNVLRRVLTKRAQPFDKVWRGAAPDDRRTGEQDLNSSGGISSKLSKRQASLHRKMFRDDRASVEIFAGPGPLTQAITNEFGTGPRFHAESGKYVGEVPPHPFVRPAWDSTKDGMLDGIKDDLWTEIHKSAVRAAKKRAKAG